MLSSRILLFCTASPSLTRLTRSEQSIFGCSAAVYYYDIPSKNWASVDGGLSRVDIYNDASRNSFRVVAIAQGDQTVRMWQRTL
jgi:hypothetical protein